MSWIMKLSTRQLHVIALAAACAICMLSTQGACVQWSDLGSLEPHVTETLDAGLHLVTVDTAYIPVPRLVLTGAAGDEARTVLKLVDAQIVTDTDVELHSLTINGAAARVPDGHRGACPSAVSAIVVCNVAVVTLEDILLHQGTAGGSWQSGVGGSVGVFGSGTTVRLTDVHATTPAVVVAYGGFLYVDDRAFVDVVNSTVSGAGALYGGGVALAVNPRRFTWDGGHVTSDILDAANGNLFSVLAPEGNDDGNDIIIEVTDVVLENGGGAAVVTDHLAALDACVIGESRAFTNGSWCASRVAVCSVCGDNEVESSACTEQDDTVCVCDTGFTRDEVSGTCVACAVCGPLEQLDSACTATVDTVCSCVSTAFLSDEGACEPCSTCTGATLVSVACSATSDTVCECSGSAFLDGDTCRTCGTCGVATNSVETVACSATTDTVCVCADGYFARSDGQCVECPEGTYGAHGECFVCGVCGPNEVETTACGAAVNVVCGCASVPGDATALQEGCGWTCDDGFIVGESGQDCVACPSGFFEASGVCLECVSCGAFEVETVACNSTYAGECGCAGLPSNASRVIDSTDGSTLCEWVCDVGTILVNGDCMTCSAGTFFDVASGECRACAGQCGVGVLTSQVCTGLSDTQCTACTTKPASASYTTAGSCDWTCDYLPNNAAFVDASVNCSFTCVAGYFEVDGAYCQECSSCGIGETEQVPCGVTDDTVCQPCGPLAAGMSYTTEGTCDSDSDGDTFSILAVGAEPFATVTGEQVHVFGLGIPSNASVVFCGENVTTDAVVAGNGSLITFTVPEVSVVTPCSLVVEDTTAGTQANVDVNVQNVLTIVDADMTDLGRFEPDTVNTFNIATLGSAGHLEIASYSNDEHASLITLDGNVVTFATSSSAVWGDDLSNGPHSFSVVVVSPTGLTSVPVTYLFDFVSFTLVTPSGALADAKRRFYYEVDLEFTATDGLDYTFSIASGSLPTGVSLGTDGTLSGEIGESAGLGTFTFDVQVVTGPITITRSYSIEVVEPLSMTFLFTGAVQEFVVPSSTSTVFLKAFGAAGGGDSSENCGGGGGFARAMAYVTPGSTLTVVVGGGGPRGLCNGSGGSGGGLAGVFAGASNLFGAALQATSLLVAGGGGGSPDLSSWVGGAGGGTTGEDGTGNTHAGIISYGGGGTATHGGARGIGGGAPGSAGGASDTATAGGALEGGHGGYEGNNEQCMRNAVVYGGGGRGGNEPGGSLGGAGGGAGYFGGGGGGADVPSGSYGGSGGGGGGSGYSHPDNKLSQMARGTRDSSTQTYSGGAQQADYQSGIGSCVGSGVTGGHGMVVIYY